MIFASVFLAAQLRCGWTALNLAASFGPLGAGDDHVVDMVAHMEVSIAMRASHNGWFFMDNPVKLDDDWGYLYFRQRPY